MINHSIDYMCVLYTSLIHAVMSTMLLRVVAVLSKSQLYAVFPAKAKSLSGESTGDTSLTTVEELGVEMVLR